MSALPHASPSGANRSIGAILVDAGRLSPENAERILRVQKEQGIRFGDAALQLKLLTDDDIRFALSNQFDYPYLPIRDARLSGELVAAYTPGSRVVEQLRALRSQLLLRGLDADAQRKALAIVSPGAREGRSFLAANLAIVFSQLGERTLLIDADLRKPRLHEMFKLRNEVGLTSFLAGRASEEAAQRVTDLRSLTVLTAGPQAPNPQELLGRPAFADLLEQVGQHYDTIILDTPPGIEFADAQTIAVRAGAALLVARENASILPDMVRLAQGLRQSGANVIGTVMNDT